MVAHNRITSIEEATFDVDEIILVRRSSDRALKPEFKWYVPVRIDKT